MGIWCQNDVVSTSMRRNHVASTLIRRHFYVMCPLGWYADGVAAHRVLFVVLPCLKLRGENFLFHGKVALTLFKPGTRFWTDANGADPVQTPLKAAFDHGLHGC